MIVRPKLHWFRMIFVWHGSVLPKMLPRLGLIMTLGLAAALVYRLRCRGWHST